MMLTPPSRSALSPCLLGQMAEESRCSIHLKLLMNDANERMGWMFHSIAPEQVPGYPSFPLHLPMTMVVATLGVEREECNNYICWLLTVIISRYQNQDGVVEELAVVISRSFVLSSEAQIHVDFFCLVNLEITCADKELMKKFGKVIQLIGTSNLDHWLPEKARLLFRVLSACHGNCLLDGKGVCQIGTVQLLLSHPLTEAYIRENLNGKLQIKFVVAEEGTVNDNSSARYAPNNKEARETECEKGEKGSVRLLSVGTPAVRDVTMILG
ncbi:hypothetical protein X798_08088 [Onchocerca flexuosa]|uniref:Uncharacterized protein n=1 Tax=Onchocerca flexuosa TaxID=387005 RepID=A0A238BJA1_9BILA|nr:hypothetical protein X798_08088 [Onchocerca flexuosa]